MPLERSYLRAGNTGATAGLDGIAGVVKGPLVGLVGIGVDKHGNVFGDGNNPVNREDGFFDSGGACDLQHAGGEPVRCRLRREEHVSKNLLVEFDLGGRLSSLGIRFVCFGLDRAGQYTNQKDAVEVDDVAGTGRADRAGVINRNEQHVGIVDEGLFSSGGGGDALQRSIGDICGDQNSSRVCVSMLALVADAGLVALAVPAGAFDAGTRLEAPCSPPSGSVLVANGSVSTMR